MKKILIANIFGIGDVLFTTPLITDLKREPGDISVDYLCNSRARPVVECNPDIDGILVYEKDEFAALWKKSPFSCVRAFYSFFSSIRKKRYDTVFDFTLSREFGLLFALAGIKQRVGLDYKRRGVFLTRKIPLTGFDNKHVVEYYRDLLKFVNINSPTGKLRLVPDEEEILWARGYLEEKALRKGKLAAVVPGGGASWGNQSFRKRWGKEGFIRAADILMANGVNVAILGDRSENCICVEVSGGMKTMPQITENNLTLKRYIALLSLCDLVLCNDGGPLHIAAALGVKTVSIFGPVDEKVYGPYPPSSGHRVIKAVDIHCGPCYNRFKLPECAYDHKCLRDISPEIVAEACMDLLAQGEEV
ncbi:MAG: glycosyltransferase family 9 protein [Candidatus Omnitrophota bacterium]